MGIFELARLFIGLINAVVIAFVKNIWKFFNKNKEKEKIEKEKSEEQSKHTEIISSNKTSLDLNYKCGHHISTKKIYSPESGTSFVMALPFGIRIFKDATTTDPNFKKICVCPENRENIIPNIVESIEVSNSSFSFNKPLTDTWVNLHNNNDGKTDYISSYYKPIIADKSNMYIYIFDGSAQFLAVYNQITICHIIIYSGSGKAQIITLMYRIGNISTGNIQAGELTNFVDVVVSDELIYFNSGQDLFDEGAWIKKIEKYKSEGWTDESLIIRAKESYKRLRNYLSENGIQVQFL